LIETGPVAGSNPALGTTSQVHILQPTYLAGLKFEAEDSFLHHKSVMPGVPGLVEPFSGEEDESLLRMANEYAKELGFKDTQIKRGLWAWTVASDQCWLSRESMICPLGMREVLTLEEWKPIIVAAIFYYRKTNERGMITSGFRTMIPYVFLPMIPFLVPILFFVNTNPLLAIALVVAYTPVYAVVAKYGFTRYSPLLRTAMLEADAEAKAFLGNNSLLEILKRIDRFGLDDVEKLKTQKVSSSRKIQRPSITRRIESLSASNLAPVRPEQ